ILASPPPRFRPLPERGSSPSAPCFYPHDFTKTLLKVGDSLRESIDKGLASTRFGIIVLSKAFFGKRWTQYELNGLLAREHQGRKLVLPVWYELSHDEVVAYSPSLADKVALTYPRLPIAEIATLLAARVRDPQL
ncbi:MAG TPA: toll/interleukin-1 receptor domain-containing protein, partial [Candidatus Acidoferrum sp.]|nr:toll/interleukin-1 receptor domain-containing protein [Candidatus Acidoferrum sp.]